MILTPEGKLFLDKISKHQTQIENELLSSFKGVEKLAVKIGSIDHFAGKFLLPILKKHRSELPVFQVFMLRSLQQFQWVEKGDLDFAFVSWTRQPKGLNFIPVRKEDIAIVGLKSEFAHIEKAKSLEDLKDEPWVYMPKPQYESTTIFARDQRGYVIDDIYGLKNLLFGGHAIGEAQLDAFTDEERKLLVRAPIPTLHPDTTTYAIFRKNIGKFSRKQLEFILEKIEK